MAYSDEEWDRLADEFEDHVAQGGGINEFFEAEHRPTRHTFYARMKRDSNLEERYERAVKWRALLIVDEMAEVQKKLENGDMQPGTANTILKNLQWRAERFFKRQFGTPQETVVASSEDVKKLILQQMKEADARMINVTPNKVSIGDGRSK